MLRRNPAAGEDLFTEYLVERGDDPMLYFERGKARQDVGDVVGARTDLERAAREFPRADFQRMARNRLSQLPSPPQVTAKEAPASRVDIPDKDDLLRAHRIFFEKEPRAVDFDVASRLLSEALQKPASLTPAVPVSMLLQSWNFAYYQDGRVFDAAHFNELDHVLNANLNVLNGYRRRNLSSLSDTDEQSVKSVFRELASVVGRVGAAKSLHLWAPEFFPLWDNPIANAYGFDLAEPAEQYSQFMMIVRAQIADIDPPAGVTPLKALDEYNYCRFTKNWLTG